MHSQAIRLLTTLAVIGVCGWPLWQGVEIIRYEMAGTKAEAARPWVDVPGIESAAREYSMTPVDASSDDKTIAKRRDELVEFLAIRPLAPRFWLFLAEMRIDAQEDPARAIDALELSNLTGPNEGYMITQRGLFGVWQWEALPPDVKKHAITDLVSRQISDSKLAWMKAALAKKPEQVRQEIRSDLQAQGFSEGNFARIGM